MRAFYIAFLREIRGHTGVTARTACSAPRHPGALGNCHASCPNRCTPHRGLLIASEAEPSPPPPGSPTRHNPIGVLHVPLSPKAVQILRADAQRVTRHSRRSWPAPWSAGRSAKASPTNHYSSKLSRLCTTIHSTASRSSASSVVSHVLNLSRMRGKSRTSLSSISSIDREFEPN